MSEAQRFEEDAAPEPVTPPDVPSSEPLQPATEPAAATGEDEFERALAEFDAANKPAPTPEPAAETSPNDLDQLLAEIDQPQQQQPTAPTPNPAEQQLQALQQEIWRQSEARALSEYCSQLQDRRCPDYTPDGYIESELRSMASSDPSLEIAWFAERENVDPNWARVKLDQIVGVINRLKLNSTANPHDIAALERVGWKLNVAVHRKSILRRAEEQVIAKSKAKRPIDPDATADRLAVVQAVRGQSGTHVEEPPPDLSRMSDNEFRDFKRGFGFE